MVATPGTIPALPQYQPSALPLAGTEALEIVNTTNSTAASSWFILLTDLVGKAPGVMNQATPTANDIVAFMRSSGTGVSYFATTVANIATVPAGNLPTGGATGTILAKNSAVNYDASWDALSTFVTASTGISVAGSTGLTFALATTTPLSVLGVAGAATTNPVPIAGTAAQVLRLNDAGTQVAFGPVNLASAAAVTGVLPGAFYSAVNLGAGNVAGGVQGSLPLASIASVAGLTLLTNASTGQTTVVATTLSLFLDSAMSSTEGAILYRSSASWLALAAGSTGKLLQTQGTSSPPQWIGGAVLLNTLSPSNVASTNDTSSLTSTYRNYMITFENICPVTQTTTFEMQVATTGNAYVSGGYVSLAQVNVSSIVATDTSTTAMLLSGTRVTTQLQTSLSYGLNGSIIVNNPAGTTFRKSFRGEVSYLTAGASGTTTFAMADIAGYLDVSNAVIGVNFLFNSGNIQTGTIRIYGLY